MNVTQFAFLTLECVVGAALVLLLLRARYAVGLGALLVTLGSWQFLQTLLANTYYVSLGGGLTVSPGSTALFAGTLFAVLAVYVRLGALEARRLILGLIAANLALIVWSLMLGWHLTSQPHVNLLGVPTEIFALNTRLILAGTMVMALDVLLITLVWEIVGRVLPLWVTARAILSLALVLAMDSILFSTGAFAGTEFWLPILASGLVGKTWCALVYGLLFGAWLASEGPQYGRVIRRGPVQGLLSDLAFGQQREAPDQLRDGETGLYSLGFFRDVLGAEVVIARRAGRPAVLVLFDLDGFRAFTREHGPEVRTRVIAELSLVLLAEIRPQELAVRYGEDGFALYLSDGGIARGRAVATAVLRRFGAALASAVPPLPAVTATVGIAEVDEGCDSARALTFAAEARVHRGKVEGRNRVVSSGS